ncbi:SLBB domain-containing protein [Halospina sp. K52047b]|uniref:SLBB domain-containing protein n=1 Tax=Halospina sp. K52047b TaxID=2614160 RepID=UPI00124A4FB2|nr:SLBB domain-containing protein [Halospina sp. K52047b]KAA8981921.1 sugar transporter [Halospina sp. K52047b]
MTRTLQRLILLFLLGCALPASAQSIPDNLSQSQIDRFMSLPQAQQEALAEQYGVDINNLRQQARGDSLEEPDEPVVRRVNREPGSSNGPGRETDDRNGDDSESSEGDGELEPYGYELFEGAPSTFAPVTEIPMPSDYTIAPGDVVSLQLYGKKNGQFELPVKRNGNIDIPEIGPHNVAGLSFSELQSNLKNLISERYIGVQASVSMGELRSMRIFVLGEARTPGAYTVSSLSTITNALFVSGGVKESGSLRTIKHKRDGEVVGELDLYDLLLNGNTEDDARLKPGDVIFIPPVGPRVGVSGEVYRPALYELDGESSVQGVIDLAGGLTPQAYPQITRIERTNENFLRVITEANLTKAKGRQKTVEPGDRIDVASISDITGQYVEVKGAATRTGRFAWVPGMRVSSLITGLDSSLMPVADQRYAAIVRTDPETDQVSVINVRLRQAVENPGSEADVQLQEEDQLLIFSDAGKAEGGEEGREYTREDLFAPVLRRLKSQAGPESPQQTVTISGPVRYPGEYPMPASHSVRDAIWVAGGLEDSASLHAAEVARYETPEQGSTDTRIIDVNLKPIMNGEADFRLQSRDRLLVKRIPDYARTRTVSLEGEVQYPGDYTFRKGESLASVLKRAGGLTDNAFPRGAVFTRESLKEREAERLRDAEKRLKGNLLGQQLEGEDFGQSQSQGNNQGTVRDLLDDVQDAEPVGRMVIDLQAAINGTSHQPIRLQDGDSLTVPEQPQSVSVFGEVQFPTSHLHKPGLSAQEYIERSGGPTAQADESRMYVVKADGSVVMPSESHWFGGRETELRPGDTVVMPIDVDRISQLQLWTDVSQIIYQMSLGAAAVNGL